jgi:transcriptional antiterminator NusG
VFAWVVGLPASWANDRVGRGIVVTDNTHNPTDETATHASSFGSAEGSTSDHTPPPEQPAQAAAAPQPVESARAEPAASEAGVEAEVSPAEPQISHAEQAVSHAEQPVSHAEQPVSHAEQPAHEEEERGPIEEINLSEVPPQLRWYILKVQSNREDSIREGLQRRVHMAGLERFFGDIIVPTEMVSEFKGGKKRVVRRKLYPGYLVVHMEINEDTWFVVRETPGIGDFTGSAGKPTPMLPHEVSKIIAKQEEKTDESPKLKINFNKGDRVKINEGTFENFEGEVDSLDEASGRVTVMINIFGRSTPVELEYWQVEAL